ncbi:DUF1330 domain-containing protein [Myceligenerans crystallogenes]|uniref:DUF1330 domain-containing protein n=1 Tax=Myceligenerans crystallogenes TaxID=316335 RepID=A0ABN2NF93_9MICO
MAAYVIAEAEHLDDPDVRRYRELAAESIARYDGRYLARGATPEPLEGEWPDTHRMVVIEFPSMVQAKNWYTSPEYADARAVRGVIAGRRMLFVEGLVG